MFEQESPVRMQTTPTKLDRICADYLTSLHRSLFAVRDSPRETRLQRERLSIRFARKIRVGERVLPVGESADG